MKNISSENLRGNSTPLGRSLFLKKVSGPLLIALWAMEVLALLLQISCFSISSSSPPRTPPFQDLSKSTGRGADPSRSPGQEASPSLRTDRIYLRGRVVEIKNLFSDLTEKFPLVVVEQNFSSEPLKKIFSLSYSREEDPQDWEWIQEGKIYWMAVTVRERDIYLDLIETKRIRQNRRLQKKLLERSPPRGTTPSAELIEKRLEEFQRKSSPAEEYLKKNLPACLPALLALLSKTEDESLLQRGFMVLSTRAHKKALEFLKSFNSHPSPTVRLCAAVALGEMAHPEALGALYTFSADPHPEVVSTVAYYARFSPSPLSLPLLKKLLQNPSKEVRQKALQSLGILKAKKMDRELIDQFPRYPTYLKEETIKALGRIATPLALTTLAQWVEKLPLKFSLVALKALRSNGEKALPHLIQLLQHRDPYIHWRVLYELRSITGQSFGFALPLSPHKKKGAQKKWQEWWKRQGHKFDNPGEKE